MTRTRSTRLGLLALLSTLVLLATAAMTGTAQANTPTTHTITFQCNPSLPDYGTNTSRGEDFPVKVGDTIQLVFQGSGCLDGSGHFRGDWRTMYESMPAWNGSCCNPIPNGAVYLMRVKQYSSDTRWGKAGAAALVFFNNSYTAMELVYPQVQPPAPGDPTVFRPGPPTLSNARPGERDAWIDFKPGFDGGSPVQRFEYRIISPTVEGWVSVPATSRNFSVPGLKLFTDYQVELRAVNAVGTGPASLPISFRTKAMPPGPPTDLVADPNDGSTTIAFTPGTDGGADIVKYQYQLDGGAWVDVRPATAASPVKISGLVNYRTYSIKLRAVNKAGEIGTPSAAVTVEPGPSPVTIQICHWNGEDYEQATTTDAVFRGKGEHAGHDDDIIPEVVGRGGARNWDSGGVAIWLNDCQRTKPADTDKDGIIDLVDTDDDGDGIPDVSDRDDDGDGILDAEDADYESKTDSDKDGIPNAVESDDDGDGIADEFDNDRDGNGIIDVTEPDLVLLADSDGDGLPDSREGDKDGDCIADVKDLDDNGDGVPDIEQLDVNGDGQSEEAITEDFATLAGQCRKQNIPAAPLDSDRDGVPNTRDKDIDGDGIPNAFDRDADGDFVLDTRDGDANNDGIIETKDQPLVAAFSMPSLTAGKRTTIVAGQTVAGQTAGVEVTCEARTKAKGALAPAGDIAAPSSKELCDVVQKDGGVQITVTGDQPTLVTIRLTAPATGEYKAFRQVEQVVVR